LRSTCGKNKVGAEEKRDTVQRQLDYSTVSGKRKKVGRLRPGTQRGLRTAGIRSRPWRDIEGILPCSRRGVTEKPGKTGRIRTGLC